MVSEERVIIIEEEKSKTGIIPPRKRHSSVVETPYDLVQSRPLIPPDCEKNLLGVCRSKRGVWIMPDIETKNEEKRELLVSGKI